MRQIGKGLRRLWLVGALAWLVGVVAWYWSDVTYTYNYFAKNDQFVQQAADLGCRYQIAVDAMMHPAAPVPGTAPPEVDQPLTRFTEKMNADRQIREEDDLVCNPGGWGAHNSFDEVMLCKARRTDARAQELRKKAAEQAAINEKMRIADTQLEQARFMRDLSSCIEHYQLPEPSVTWLLMALMPPTIGVLFLFMLCRAVFRLGNWVWQGFR